MNYIVDRDIEDNSGSVTISVKEFLRLYELDKNIKGVDLDKDVLYIPFTNYNYPCKILNADEGTKRLAENIKLLSTELHNEKFIADKYRRISNKWWFKLFGA